MRKFFILLIMGVMLTGCKDDQTKPEIKGVSNLIIMQGDPLPNLLDGVTVTDNVDQNLKATVEHSKVNTKVAGTYKITYRAIDSAGNETVKEATIQVISK